MAVLYYECFAGISGDMNLAALLDLGVDLAYLRAELAKLNASDQFQLIVKRDQKNGIYGNRVMVQLIADAPRVARDFKQIVKMIDDSALSARVKRDSSAIFEIIARAEGKVHGIDYRDVHFHEIGAVDSIVDIVAAAICMECLNATEIVFSDIELGSGFVDCAHGKLPIPAPATADILLGFTTKQTVQGYEMTTPTGAAILKYYGRQIDGQTTITGQKIGYGLGAHQTTIPNMLRVTLLAETAPERQILIESNIDDMSPEKLAFVQQKLFEIGARDVFLTPIIMKKGRLASKLTVLLDKALRSAALAVIFRQSSAIGLRIFDVEKVELTRRTVKIATEYGEIAVKLAYYGDELVNFKAEYDAAVAAAERHQVTLEEVDRAVAVALAERGVI